MSSLNVVIRVLHNDNLVIYVVTLFLDTNHRYRLYIYKIPTDSSLCVNNYFVVIGLGY